MNTITDQSWNADRCGLCNKARALTSATFEYSRSNYCETSTILLNATVEVPPIYARHIHNALLTLGIKYTDA